MPTKVAKKASAKYAKKVAVNACLVPTDPLDYSVSLVFNSESPTGVLLYDLTVTFTDPSVEAKKLSYEIEATQGGVVLSASLTPTVKTPPSPINVYTASASIPCAANTQITVTILVTKPSPRIYFYPPND